MYPTSNTHARVGLWWFANCVLLMGKMQSIPWFWKPATNQTATVDGRNAAPVEVGSLAHYLHVFFTSQVVVWDFFHQQYHCITISSAVCPSNIGCWMVIFLTNVDGFTILNSAFSYFIATGTKMINSQNWCQGTRTGVPRSRTCTTMVFIVFNLGVLRDYNP